MRQHINGLGEKIEQIRLDDPDVEKQSLSRIMQGRPEMHFNKAMTFVFIQPIENSPVMNTGNATATEPKNTDPAEGAMDVIVLIQSEMRSYTDFLSNKRFSNLMAMHEQSPITQHARGIAAGKAGSLWPA